MAENLRDLLWSLEFLARESGVDSERLGCVGLSLGGRMTMLTTALEPRLKVAVISGALNCMQERAAMDGGAGGCQTIPGLLEYGDFPEIGGLIAPRPALWAGRPAGRPEQTRLGRTGLAADASRLSRAGRRRRLVGGSIRWRA